MATTEIYTYGHTPSLHDALPISGRIDLGLGRAPGSDQATMRALRRDHSSAESFPQDVLELQAYLRGQSRIPGVQAVPGARSEKHTSELQSLMRITYAVFCLKKKKQSIRSATLKQIYISST